MLTELAVIQKMQAFKTFWRVPRKSLKRFEKYYSPGRNRDCHTGVVLIANSQHGEASLSKFLSPLEVRQDNTEQELRHCLKCRAHGSSNSLLHSQLTDKRVQLLGSSQGDPHCSWEMPWDQEVLLASWIQRRGLHCHVEEPGNSHWFWMDLRAPTTV